MKNLSKKKVISYSIIILIIVFSLQSLAFNILNAGEVGTISILNASELTVGDIVQNTTSGIFTIKATGLEKQHVTIQTDSKTAKNANISFSNRLKLNGVGDSTYRSIHFTTDSASQIDVYSLSSSSGQDRKLALYNAATDELVNSITVPGGLTTGISNNEIPVINYLLEESGSYYFVAEVGAVNIYQIQVEELGELAPKAEWSTVTAPVLGEPISNTEKIGVIDVPYTMLIGRDGADKLTIKLLDLSDKVLSEKIITTFSTSGTAEIIPPATGDYIFTAEASRSDESNNLTSNTVELKNYIQPLVLPTITKIKTGLDSSAVIQWLPVDGAESYTVEYKSSDSTDYIVLVENLTTTENQWKIDYTIPNLKAETSYDIMISAIRGNEKQSTTTTYKISNREDIWTWGNVGSGANGTVTTNEDGSLSFDAIGGKLADSEDGFTYYYTEINPTTENFTLTATFKVDDAAKKDNQSGFGVLAADTIVENLSSARYFNNAAALVAKYYDEEEGLKKYGVPGGRFVSGYTEAPTEGSPNRNLMNKTPFDWEFKNDYVLDNNANPPKFETGEEYTLTLRKSNTGYHAYMNNDTTNEIIYYGTDLLNVQESNKVYVGMCVSRKIKCTVTDYTFTKITPEDDEAAQERPIEYTTPKIELDTTITSSKENYQAVFVSNVKGNYTITDKKGNIVKENTVIEAKERSFTDLKLSKGKNEYVLTYTPASHEEQGFEDYEQLDSYDSFEYNFSITYKTYGTEENSIYVSPEGKTSGKGTKKKPLDIYTAVSYAQAGQTIILTGGNYDITKSLLIERGNNGTADKKIVLMSDPDKKAILDLTNSNDGGILLEGNYWHIYNIDVTNSQNNSKPLQITGNNNTIEKCNSYNNSNTGIQISGYASESTDMWPSNNLILSCESYNNCDSGGNDADGFAAKLTCGEGNVFKYCISHHNIDDGWDLYAKSVTGPIGVVTIDSCVTYNNGYLTEDTGNKLTGEGNGFKLGGESMPGAHILKNSISFNNLAKGITSNSGPDCKVFDSISYKNGTENLSFYTSGKLTTYELKNTISYAGKEIDKIALKNQATLAATSNFIDGKNSDGLEVSDEWFKSLDTTIIPTIAEDGSIDMNGLLELTDIAAEDVGAVISTNDNPTEINIGSNIENKKTQKIQKIKKIIENFWSKFFRWFN